MIERCVYFFKGFFLKALDFLKFVIVKNRVLYCVCALLRGREIKRKKGVCYQLNERLKRDVESR